MLSFMLQGVLALLLAQGSATQPASPETPQAVKITVPAPYVEAPMQYQGDYPLLDVIINHQGPFQFGFDSAFSGQVLLKQSLFERLDLEVTGEIQAGDPSGKNMMSLKQTQFGSLVIAGAEFTNVTAEVIDFPAHSPSGALAGLLGSELFTDALLTLDYLQNSIRIEKGALPDPDGQQIFDMAPDILVPAIMIPVQGRDVTFFLDTRSNLGLTIPESVVEQLTFKSAPKFLRLARTMNNTYEISRAQLEGNLKIGEHVLVEPQVTTTDMFDHGILGATVMKHFQVTFDQTNHRVRLKRASVSPIIVISK